MENYNLINDAKPNYGIDIHQLRENFKRQYCERNNWDLNNLNQEQLNEIKMQKGYKAPNMILG